VVHVYKWNDCASISVNETSLKKDSRNFQLDREMREKICVSKVNFNLN
jgi:hypothetical protein